MECQYTARERKKARMRPKKRELHELLYTKIVRSGNTILGNFQAIEEGLIQKTRQTVVISVWGARSYAAMGIFVLNVQYCVHRRCTFPFTFVGGGWEGCMPAFTSLAHLRTCPLGVRACGYLLYFTDKVWI